MNFLYCDVYWGSHGCNLAFNHEGPCECDCTKEGNKVGFFPYYGKDTNFYGNNREQIKKLLQMLGGNGKDLNEE